MFKNGPRPQVSSSLSLPAGTGGLNDLDPIARMGPEYLLECTNFYPDTGQLVVRPGYQEWAVNINAGAPIKTIMYYNGLDGAFKRFASTDAGIYEITAPISNPALAKAATDGSWEFVNYANAATNYLVAVNGVDAAVLYNGAAWTSFTEVVTPAAPGEIKGVNPNLFSYVLSHKGRLWFIEKNSMRAWYLPVDAVGGEAKPFYLGGIFRRGGYLMILARWSADTGEGLDDRLIFISSTGEIASYQGSDPASASTWELDSIFFVAPPLSKRSVTEYGGDLLMLCRRGLIPLSSLISGVSNEVIFSTALTKRISRTLIRLTAGDVPLFPSEVTLYNDAAWAVINIWNGVPDVTSPYGIILGEGNKPIQLVMNVLTGAWGKFDYPVRTVRTIDKLFFMGTSDGRVLAVTPDSYLDNIRFDGVTPGVAISASAMGAYTYLENQNSNKHAKMIQPLFQTEVKPSFRMRTLPNFRLDRFLATPPTAVAIGNAKWDISRWDEANWAGLENVYQPWVGADVLGRAFAWQLRVSTASALGLAATQWIWEDGGFV